MRVCVQRRARHRAGHIQLRTVQGKAGRVEASIQVTVAWESIQDKYMTNSRNKTSHSHLQGNTRHTQYLRQYQARRALQDAQRRWDCESECVVSA